MSEYYPCDSFTHLRKRRFLGCSYIGFASFQLSRAPWNTEYTEDYQRFASERSEDLAQAIAKGIPSTLRGMMWQLMYFLFLALSMLLDNLFQGLHQKTLSLKVHTSSFSKKAATTRKRYCVIWEGSRLLSDEYPADITFQNFSSSRILY